LLPVVYFADTPPGILTTVPTATEVTFTINMANAAEYGNPGVTFNPSTDQVYVNGDFLGWPTWNVPTLGGFQLTNNPPGSTYYSLTYQINGGNSLLLTYKYGMNNAANSASYNDLDDEGGFGQNHQRYIRTAGTCTLPVDTFGNQYDEPVATGNLSVGKISGGTVPITWLGLPGVHLQTSTSLAGNNWVDHPETDGATWSNIGYYSNNVFIVVGNAGDAEGAYSNNVVGGSIGSGFISLTNYPAGSSSMFFRLVRPVVQ